VTHFEYKDFKTGAERKAGERGKSQLPNVKGGGRDENIERRDKTQPPINSRAKHHFQREVTSRTVFLRKKHFCIFIKSSLAAAINCTHNLPLHTHACAQSRKR